MTTCHTDEFIFPLDKVNWLKDTQSPNGTLNEPYVTKSGIHCFCLFVCFYFILFCGTEM
jgi:hypothetical protein